MATIGTAMIAIGVISMTCINAYSACKLIKTYTSYNRKKKSI